METVNPNNPHTVAYARRIGELEETVRVQGERIKYLEERMHLCQDEGCENQPTPHTHPGL
jgi:hypothetical protein